MVRAYADFMGCVVDAGDHRVRFEFEPESLRAGKRMSAVGASLIALACAIALVFRSRAPG